ncbi:MAG: choline dehydrogenase [Pseudomonadota bacterium]
MAEFEQIEGRFDYIIIGSGSAGSVLARRLSEDGSSRILILEAGTDKGSIFVDMPSALSIPMNTRRYNWGLKTEPEPHLGNRIMNLPRGKGVGGSSLINGMCYVRGNPLDYERWAFLGASGWNWSNVLPYFKRAETVRDDPGEHRGTAGPLNISAPQGRNPLFPTFLEAGRDAGYAISANMNDAQHEGFSPMEMTVSDGIRWSAARAYLKPSLKTGRVRVMTGALVEKILIENGRAKGVLFERGGKSYQANADREVILSAGSIMSPTILKRSGIGPGEELRQHGIDVRMESCGVGANLMDHLELYIQQECTQSVSLYKWMNALGKAYIGGSWLLTRKGLGATNHFEAGAHIRSKAGIGYPDIQFHFLPLAISYDGSSMAQSEGFQVHVGTKRSKSRGNVSLRSSSARDMPKVVFNYMSHADDWADMRRCVEYTREVFAQPSFDPFRGRELKPGSSTSADDELNEFIRANVESAYHPCGTCRMGSDEMAVTGPDCKVHGVDALRVIDASIMPQATAGDLNGPTIMLAEKAADIIRGHASLTDPDAPIPIDAKWRDRQRSRSVDKDISHDPKEIEAIMQAEPPVRMSHEQTDMEVAGA